MQTKIHFKLISGNQKTGPIPVSTSGNNTCPDSCKLKNNGCYAEYGPLNLHWQKVSSGERDLGWENFIAVIKKFPKFQIWRHNQAGDLAGDKEQIDAVKLRQIISANHGKRGFTYTHKFSTIENQALIEESNNNGFTINISANNIDEADHFFSAGFPTTTLIPADFKGRKTRANNPIVKCPNEIDSSISCARCGLCQKADRKFIIGFMVHGSGKKRANKIANGEH